MSLKLTVPAPIARNAKNWASNLAILVLAMFVMLLLSGARYAARDAAVGSIQTPAAKSEAQ